LGEDAGVFEGGEPVSADFAGESESESGGGTRAALRLGGLIVSVPSTQ